MMLDVFGQKKQASQNVWFLNADLEFFVLQVVLFSTDACGLGWWFGFRGSLINGILKWGGDSPNLS